MPIIFLEIKTELRNPVGRRPDGGIARKANGVIARSQARRGFKKSKKDYSSLVGVQTEALRERKMGTTKS